MGITWKGWTSRIHMQYDQFQDGHHRIVVVFKFCTYSDFFICTFVLGAFAFSGFYHRHSETTYVGPHAEQFQAKDPSQGLYCHSDDNWSDAQCIYKYDVHKYFYFLVFIN